MPRLRVRLLHALRGDLPRPYRVPFGKGQQRGGRERFGGDLSEREGPGGAREGHDEAWDDDGEEDAGAEGEGEIL